MLSYYLNFGYNLVTVELMNWLARVMNMGHITRTRKTMDVSYRVNGEVYTVRFKSKLTPSKIHFISDHEGNDVTKEVRRFMGPYQNFHGISTTPKFLGYKELTFHFIDNSFKLFNEEDEISI